MIGCVGPRERKKRFATYGDALRAFVRLEKKGLIRPGLGEIYECLDCEGFHITSRRFTLVKPKGRGKRRRKMLRDAG